MAVEGERVSGWYGIAGGAGRNAEANRRYRFAGLELDISQLPDN